MVTQNPEAFSPVARESAIGLIAAIAASAFPLLLAYNLSPSPTFLNQALAIVLWGWFAAYLAMQADCGALGGAVSRCGTLLAALLLVTLSALGSWLLGGLPSSLALSGAGLVLAAMVMVISGATARSGENAVTYFSLFCWGWVVAGVLNAAIAFVQVFAPGLPDGDWIAHSGIVGRAVGNIRQPNHLSSLLLWSALAVIGLLELRRLGRATAVALFAAMVLAVLLTASRTGLVSVALLAVWGLADRRLSRIGRATLIAAPALYALGWAAMAWWAAAGEHTFGGTARLAEADISGSRFAIWSNTLELIRRQPWVGVGFGEFNFAWTLTPFPRRPIAFFDHTHNLPLQLAVELGLPLGLTILSLLTWALWLAWRTMASDSNGMALSQRCAWMMVAMIGLHSQLEYPLWYAYFLLPAAWAWGYGLGSSGTRSRQPQSRLVMACLAVVAAGVLSVVDYARVVPIFEAPDGAAPLSERIAAGQHSLLFSHHADYAAATAEPDGHASLPAFTGATHYLLDTRLMMAWAEATARAGRMDEARHLAARVREFHNPLSKEFFEACGEGKPDADASFRCQPPIMEHDWREFTTTR